MKKEIFGTTVSFRVGGVKKTGRVVGESGGIVQVWSAEEERSYFVEQRKLRIISKPLDNGLGNLV